MSSLTVLGALCVRICLFERKPDSFPLPLGRVPGVPIFLVFRSGFASFLKTCFPLGQTSDLWIVPKHLLSALLSLVFFRVPSGTCWVSFKRVDCNFLCGFLCLDETLNFDLLCLGGCFEVLVLEPPRRRQLQRDVFMHCSFFGKLKDKREKSQLIIPKSSQALSTASTNFQQKSTKFITSPRPVYMYNAKHTKVSKWEFQPRFFFRA